MTGHDRINSVLVFQRTSSRPHKKMARRICAFYDATAHQPQSGAFGLRNQDDGQRDGFFALHFRSIKRKPLHICQEHHMHGRRRAEIHLCDVSLHVSVLG